MSPTNSIFHEIFLHINWHCHGDRSLILPEIETSLHELVQTYCRKHSGVFYQGSGGTDTHIHLAVQVTPTVCPRDFIGKVKGFTSHEMNRILRSRGFQWQRGYGVVSFAKRNLPAVLKYIENQKDHHRCGGTRPTLEKWFVDLPEGEYSPGEDG